MATVQAAATAPKTNADSAPPNAPTAAPGSLRVSGTGPATPPSAAKLYAPMRSTQMATSTLADPILIPCDMNYQSPLGYGVDPYTGSLTTASITWNGAQMPSTNPGGENDTYAEVSLVSDQQTFVSSLSAGVTISGSYGPVSGSLNAQYSQQQSWNTSSVVLFAICDAINGAFSIVSSGFESNFTQTGDNSIAWAVDYITANGYQAFVNEYGTHFVSGVHWGMRYRGSYCATFSSSETAESFAATVNADYNGVAASGSLVATFAQQASSSSGYSGASGWQDGVGFSVTAGSASADTIMSSLNNWNSQEPGGGEPLMYSCSDWRIIPAIATAADSYPGSPSANWSAFSTNLSLVAQCWGALQYNYLSAQNSPAVGATAQAWLTYYATQLLSALDGLTALTAADVCNWSSSEYSTQVGWLQDIQNIANGGCWYTVTVTLDAGYTSPANSGKPSYSATGGPWTLAPFTNDSVWGFVVVKPGLSTVWGVSWVSPGVIQSYLYDGNPASQTLTWSPSQGSVEAVSAAYSYHTCTVTVC